MIAELGRGGKVSWIHCFSCDTNMNLSSALRKLARYRDSTKIGKLATWVMNNDATEPRGLRQLRDLRPDKLDDDEPVQDHTQTLAEYMRNEWPTAMTSFLETKGVSEAVARRFKCAYSPDPSPGVLLPLLDMQHNGKLKCIQAQWRAIFQSPLDNRRYFTKLDGPRSHKFFGEQFSGHHHRHEVILVEGPFDCMHVAEVLEDEPFYPLALFGIGFSEARAKHVKRLCSPKVVHMMLDPDQSDPDSERCRRQVSKFKRHIESVGLRARFHRLQQDPKYLSREELLAHLRRKA